MKRLILLIALFLINCSSTKPDDALFREQRSQEWQDGFQAGVIEGVLLTKD